MEDSTISRGLTLSHKKFINHTDTHEILNVITPNIFLASFFPGNFAYSLESHNDVDKHENSTEIKKINK